MIIPPLAEPISDIASRKDADRMRQVAVEFEAVFLSEMLKQTGLNRTGNAFGGGAGETAFAGLLTAEYARKLARNGGIGIAEHIFNQMVERSKA